MFESRFQDDATAGSIRAQVRHDDSATTTRYGIIKSHSKERVREKVLLDFRREFRQYRLNSLGNRWVSFKRFKISRKNKSPRNVLEFDEQYRSIRFCFGIQKRVGLVFTIPTKDFASTYCAPFVKHRGSELPKLSSSSKQDRIAFPNAGHPERPQRAVCWPVEQLS